ncbi:beta-glucan synthesis-associated [Meredithblackwellia eburnea MCA 4105]
MPSRHFSRGSLSSVSRGLISPNSRTSSHHGLSSRGHSSDENFQGSPTLESLYAESNYDDPEALGRYSFAPPRPRSSSRSSSIYSDDNNSGSLSPDMKQSSFAHSPLSRSATNRQTLLPDTPGIYGFSEKGKGWEAEPDDALHNPGKLGKRVGPARLIYEPRERRRTCVGFSAVGLLNVAALTFLVVAIVGVFAGYPIASHYTDHAYVNTTSYIGPTSNTTTSSSSGLINSNAPNISNRALIDPDTPTSAYTKTGVDGDTLQLVFSDEFNVAGRTFYVDEDPFWEAVNLHYWATGDLEWYDPDRLITEDGYLAITLSKETAANSHGLGYLGGMIQSWNKFCFTGGRIEVAISLPGTAFISGFWPAAWLMGNLGRPGYGSTTEGNWPYAYDTCDLGTLPNQTDSSGLPAIEATSGLSSYDYKLSYLPGQRLSRCTCPGENHPGPTYANGTFPGRAASEIDLFEATASTSGGEVSQSYQVAPFDAYYYIKNSTTSEVDYYSTDWDTAANTYLGGAYQQAVSAISGTDSTTYNSTTEFSVFGVEYTPSYIGGVGTGEIYWINQGETMWRLSDTAIAANTETEIGPRIITGEPMAIIMNLGLSESFTTISTKLTYPATMRVDYVRIYQPADQINIGCSPELYPTADYIANNLASYSNPNLTTYAEFRESVGLSTSFPKNRLTDTCT